MQDIEYKFRIKIPKAHEVVLISNSGKRWNKLEKVSDDGLFSGLYSAELGEIRIAGKFSLLKSSTFEVLLEYEGVKLLENAHKDPN